MSGEALRVLLVSHTFLPRHRAGVEHHVLHLAHALKAEGCEVAVVTTDDGPGDVPGSWVHRTIDGLGVFVIGDDRVAETLPATWHRSQVQGALEEVRAAWGPDVVHHHHGMYVGWSWPHVLSRAGVPQVLTLHDFWMLCGRKGQLVDQAGLSCSGPEPARCAFCLAGHRIGRTRREACVLSLVRRIGLDPLPLLRRLVGGRRRGAPQPLPREQLVAREAAAREAFAVMDAVTAPSTHLTQRFASSGFPSERIERQPYGIALPQRSGGEGREKGRAPRFGWFGTLVPAKGADLALDAFLQLPEGAATLVIRGRADVAPAFVAGLRERSKHRPDVAILPAFEPAEALEAYDAIDALLVTSRWPENAPIVISEARARGLPVIGTASDGVAELVAHEVDGLLAPAEGRSGFSALLRRCVEEADLLDRLAAGVRPPPTMRADARRHLERYRSILARRAEEQGRG